MGKHRTVLVMLLVTVLIVVAISEVEVSKAQPRTLVVPDDYETVQEAINSANDGDTIFVKSGTYDGPLNQTLVIDKSISLVGEDQQNTIINLHPAHIETYELFQIFIKYFDAITINADDVKISELTLYIVNPGGYISIFGDRAEISRNNIRTGGTPTWLSLTGSHSNITDNTCNTKFIVYGSFNTIARNSLSCIGLGYGDSNIISNNNCTNIYLAMTDEDNEGSCSYNIISGNRIVGTPYDAYGMSLGNCSNNIFYDNYISNHSYGLRLYSRYDFENNTFYRNTFFASSSAHIRVYPPNPLGTNFWDNGIEGNYWDGYEGVDNDGDGIGDTPYIIDENNQDNYPLIEFGPVIPEFPSCLLFVFFLVASLTLFTAKKIWRYFT